MRSVWRYVVFATAAALLATAAGCGQNDEVVYIDVFNAYPGASSASVFGPAGTITTGLPFGQRTQNFSRVNRNIGNSFTIQLQGAPSTFETTLSLYDLYPHESATLFLKRRSGTSTVQATLFRHLRTGYKKEDRQCVMVFDNSLAVGSPDISTYNYVPIFKADPSCTGYLPSLGSYRENPEEYATEKLRNKAMQVPYLFRPNLVDKVEAFPWFAAADASEGQILDVRNVGNCASFDETDTPGGSGSDGNGANGGGQGSSGSGQTQVTRNPNRGRVFAGDDTVQFVWAPVRSILTLEEAKQYGGASSIDLQSGSTSAPPPTRKYLNCIGWDPEKTVTKNIDQLGQVPRQKIAKCKRSSFTAKPVNLNQQLTEYYFQAGLGKGIEPDQCGFDVRVASNFFTIFNRSEDEAGGEPVSSKITFPPSQFSFWVLYGRPIDPKVESWGVADKDSGGGFVTLPEYPGSPPPSSSSSSGSGSNGSGGNNGSNSSGSGNSGSGQ